MDAVNKTLYIPLYGKAYVSSRGLILHDPAMPIMGTQLAFVQEHPLTSEAMIAQLPKRKQGFFRLCFGDSFAKKLYRLYEYKKGAE